MRDALDIFFVSIWMVLIYNIASKLPCHRRKDRSYKWIIDKENRLCARCFSSYYTIPFIPIIVMINNYVTRNVLLKIAIGIILIMPLIIDGVTQAKKLRNSNNFLRTVTGILFTTGIVLVTYNTANLVWGVIK